MACVDSHERFTVDFELNFTLYDINPSFLMLLWISTSYPRHLGPLFDWASNSTKWIAWFIVDFFKELQFSLLQIINLLYTYSMAPWTHNTCEGLHSEVICSQKWLWYCKRIEMNPFFPSRTVFGPKNNFTSNQIGFSYGNSRKNPFGTLLYWWSTHLSISVKKWKWHLWIWLNSFDCSFLLHSLPPAKNVLTLHT